MKKVGSKYLISLLLALALMLCCSSYIFAQGDAHPLSQDAIKYIDASGNELECEEYTVVTSSVSTWTNGFYVVNDKVTLDRAEVNGTVDLILCDGAELTINKGLRLFEGNTLTIWQQQGKSGILTSTGEPKMAAIGGDSSHYGGTLVINGGNINASGGTNAAGIGCGQVEVLFSDHAAMTFTLNDGIVRTSGGWHGAGLGGGYNVSGANVTINGGTIYAYGVAEGSGIGSTHKANSASLTVQGGFVHAIGGAQSAGISCNLSSVTINGGEVYAEGHGGSAGIGGMGPNGGIEGGQCGTINISGGKVTAYGEGHIAIGAGKDHGEYDTDGQLNLNDSYCVVAGESEDDLYLAPKADRVSSARTNPYTQIYPCNHLGYGYDITVDEHKYGCDYCLTSSEPEPHSFDEHDHCTVCGADIVTVSFDGNGGSGNMDPKRFLKDTEYTVPGNEFTPPEGMAFKNWLGSDGNAYECDDTLLLKGSMTFTAQWADMTWSTLQNWIDNSSAGTVITLYTDLKAESTDTALTIPSGKNLTIDLNGHTLDRNLGNASGPVDGGSVIAVREGATVVIKNGTLTGGYADKGGGAFVDRSYNSNRLTLESVTVTKNKANEGGGVYNSGTIRIYDCIITENSAKNGGGLYTFSQDISFSSTIVRRTEIKENSASETGGGVYASGDTYLCDTTITDNVCSGMSYTYSFYPYASGQVSRTVTLEGGGIFIDNSRALELDGTMIVKGNSSISSGSAKENNVYIRDNGPREDVTYLHFYNSLKEGSLIGITYEIPDPAPDGQTTFPVKISINLEGKAKESHFFADDDAYYVAVSKSLGELIFGRFIAVTFDPGEIGGGSFYEKSLPGAAFTLPECSFRTIPEGMKFAGWLLNGSETVYKPGDEVTATRDMGFTAQWEKELIVKTYPEGILKDKYTVDRNALTLDHDEVCRVGYLSEEGYVSIAATVDAEGRHIYTAPDGVDTVIIVLLGDTNLDGKLTNADSTKLKAAIKGMTELDQVKTFASDVNYDHELSNADATKEKAVVKGMTTFKWELAD